MTSPDLPVSQPARAQRVSLEEVAREAGVSVASASRALSGGAVRASLQERVQLAALRLGYTPDLAAQAVARGVTKTVSLIVDYLRSPFGVEITRGVVDAASRHGLVVNVTGAETHPGDLLEMIASARALRPRSLVLATGRVQDPAIRVDLIRTLESYQASGGSVAIVDGLDLPFASCAFDEVTAAHALGRELVRLGYRRPLVFNASSERSDLAGRTQALTDGLVLAGLERAAVRLSELTTDRSSTSGDGELLELGDADVVLCVEGTIIPAVYRHIRSRGLRVGADVAVTAFGQYGFASALRPHLTTVMLPLRRAGELALEHALTDTQGEHLSLPCNLRIRASSPRRLDVSGSAEKRPLPRRERPETDLIGVAVAPLPDADTGGIMRVLSGMAGEVGGECVLTSQANLLATTSIGGSAPYNAMLIWGSLSPELAEHARAAGVHSVAVDLPSTLDAVQLSVEVAEGFQTLLEHVYALGHRRVAYVAGADQDPFEVQRRGGIDLFTATHGDVTVRMVTAGQEDVPLLVKSVLEKSETVVIAHSDVMAVRLVRSLTALGSGVPRDVSVAGFGGGWAAELSAPRLTTVKVDTAAIAHAAWRLIADGTDPGEARSVSAPLLVGESTGPAPTD